MIDVVEKWLNVQDAPRASWLHKAAANLPELEEELERMQRAELHSMIGAIEDVDEFLHNRDDE